MRVFLATLLVLIAATCVVFLGNRLSHVGTPMDPNDPREAGLLTPDVLRRNLAGASDSLLERVRKREITDAQFKDYMAKAANNLLDQVDVERIPPKKAWEYGEIYITARRWKDAKRALETAIKVAKNEDRRVNDHLRLARVLAELGDEKGAIATARKVFDVPDEAAAPILPATLLEIVPAAAGKGADAELAALLEEAIACEKRTIVDASTQPGRDFLMAKPFHIRNAWRRIIKLYEAAGKPGEAADAAGRRDAMLSQQGNA